MHRLQREYSVPIHYRSWDTFQSRWASTPTLVKQTGRTTDFQKSISIDVVTVYLVRL